MASEKKQQEKSKLHPRNKNRGRYDLSALVSTNPKLKNHVKQNKHGDDSIDFSNPHAVKQLNKAILKHYYGIENWDFPNENLSPPIPGRADYIHHIADLLKESNFGTIPTGDKITSLDIGIGANSIYPIIGVTEYGWKFIGSDIDPKSIDSARIIAVSNPSLKEKIECRLQSNADNIFQGVITKDEKIDVVVCNPPFHSSKEEALKGSRRKARNLSGKKVVSPQLNFAGISNELIYEGGEFRFVQNMIRESKKISKNCFWFSTLVSKQSNLKEFHKSLGKNDAKQVKTIELGTGNKSTRIVAWTYLTKSEQKAWRESRWK
jgi:23S rRNA (adenine1618-N6)-methyltransferase